jgi:choline-sulfatase
MDRHDDDPARPARRDFLASTAATLGALGLPAISTTAAAGPAEKAGKGNRPNFLFIMVDEMRYPPVYESAELQAFRTTYLETQNALRANGLDCRRDNPQFWSMA